MNYSVSELLIVLDNCTSSIELILFYLSWCHISDQYNENQMLDVKEYAELREFEIRNNLS